MELSTLSSSKGDFMKYTTKKTNQKKRQILIFEEDLIHLQKWGLDNYIFSMSQIITELIKINQKQELFLRGL
jgi:hypothetical protein